MRIPARVQPFINYNVKIDYYKIIVALKNTRITELENLIGEYQASYYNGEAEITDAEFDTLWDELKRLAPESPVIKRVGADSVDGFPKARHLIPMGSQEKAANPGEFREWADKLGLPLFIVQYKLDGASLELQYKNGRLDRALTRGDGIIGDDISANARKMRGVVQDLCTDWSGGIRGEVLMSHEIWLTKYSGKANCRNAANGLMRRKEGDGCEDLMLITYDVSATGNDAYFSTEIEKITWLSEHGFTVSETKIFDNAESVIQYRAIIAQERMSLPFDIDGLVVKDDKTDMNDLRRARPERQIAFKFELEQAISVLRDVEWSESGATYTPIGIIDPVRLAGTKVKRANLCNPAMIRDMKLHIGSSVIVVKRGEIIPKIEGRADLAHGELEDAADMPLFCQNSQFRPIDMPQICKTCGTALVDAGTRLYCPNTDCPKRLLHRIKKWVNVLDIREAGKKTLERLFNEGRLKRVADLYTLEVEELAAFERMGELSASKLVYNIRSPRSLSLADFIAGFDIEGVGSQIMEYVTQAGYDSLEKLRATGVEALSEVFRMGELTARVVVDGLKETADDMDAVLKTGFITIAGGKELPLTGKSFCFTGELKTMKRGDAEARVKALGGVIKTSVTQSLSYLVTNEPESGSSKNKKAVKFGITLLDEDGFLKLTEHPSGKLPNP
ncbi:MAG: NAD-dependent DNA ligase LigA [Spirochaetaceae bacterium]|jgi:DNA ligase (NAD+)|nr:NAD-dependent DNA ligase LigA [Spirochaetaceae bacterium]